MPNLRIGIEEGCEIQANKMGNVFREIIVQKFLNLEIEMGIQIHDAFTTQSRQN